MIALLAAGALVLGSGYAFAQQSPSTSTPPSAAAPSTSVTPSTGTTSGGSATTTTPQEKASGSTSSKAMQQQNSREAKEEKGEKGAAHDRVVRGPVTAVDASANPNTLVMQTGSGKQAMTVGVDVPSTTNIMKGKTKISLSDIKVGDRVALRYDRTNDRLVAEQIRILPAGSKAAKAETSKGSATATPAASKSESSKKSY